MTVASLLASLFVLPIARVAASGNNAIQLNGTSQYVTLGTAAQLRSATFTVELWFQRTGAGLPTSTGTGGVNAVPLITKGRAEGETAAADINYFLGIDATTNKLVGDFEEGQSGSTPSANHPVSGTTSIAVGSTWHHAAATYDGSTWNLYLDGALDGTLAVGKPANAQTNSLSTVGSALTTAGVAAGFFAGTVDEVRIWDVARTGPEILAAKDSEIAGAQTHLLGRWGMNEASGATAADSAGNGIGGVVVGGATRVAGFPGGSPANTAPAAVADSYSTPTNTTLTVAAPGVLANDSDADADPLSAIKVSDPTHGTLTLGATGSISYVPTTGYSGPDSFTYKANDGTVDSNTVTVSLTVTAPGGSQRGWWKFDGNATDSSGSANNATLVGSPAFVAGQLGSALQLNGTSQYASVADAASLDLTTGLTLAAWIRPGVAVNTTQDVMKKASTTGTLVNGYELALSSAGKVFVRFNQATSADTFRVNSTSSYPLSSSAWMHVAATYDGTTIRIYINGLLEGSVAGPAAIATNSLPLSLGAQSDASRFYTGLLDDARVYATALSATEIAALAGGPPANTAPVAVADSYSTPTNTTLTVAAPGVLANDSDADADPLSAIKVSDPTHGTLTLGATGSISYVPTTGYSGPDSFTYKANDGTVDSNTVTVSLTVTAPGGSQRGWWKFDGNATDSSGSANNATLVGSPAFVAGQLGSALQLNGTSQYASVADAASLDLTTGLTLAAWIRPGVAVNTTQDVMKKASTTGTLVNGYELALSSAGKVFVRFNQATSADTFRVNSTSSYPLSSSALMHVAATYRRDDHPDLHQRPARGLGGRSGRHRHQQPAAQPRRPE